MITFNPNCTLPSKAGAYIAAPNLVDFAPQCPSPIYAAVQVTKDSSAHLVNAAKGAMDVDQLGRAGIYPGQSNTQPSFPEDLSTGNEEEREAPASAPNQHISSASSQERISDTAEQNSDAISQSHIPAKHSELSSSAGAEPGVLRPDPTSVTQGGGQVIMSLALTRSPQPQRNSSRIARDRVEDWIELEHVPRAGMGQREEALPPTNQQAKLEKPQSERERLRSKQAKASDKYGTTAWRWHSHNESIGKAFQLRYGGKTHSNARKRVYAMESNFWVLTATQLEYARSCGIISKVPRITYDEIADKGKGDLVAKALAISQAILLILQLAARAEVKKPSSQLEIATLAFSILAIVTYILLFEYPQDLGVPIQTHASRLPSTDEFQTILDMAPSLCLGAASSGDTSIPNDAVPVVGKDDDLELVYLMLGTTIGSFVFGCIHLLAWNSGYPNETERILWIVSSFITALVPALAVVISLISVFAEELLPSTSTFGPQRGPQGRGIRAIGASPSGDRKFGVEESWPKYVASSRKSQEERGWIADLHLPMRCGSKQGRVKNQLIFRQAVRLLLDVLSDWGDIGDNVPSSNLSLTIQPVYDSVGLYDDQYNKRSLRKVDFGPSKLLLDRKFLTLWSDDRSAVVLSPMPCIKRLTASNSKDFVLCPRTLCAFSGTFTRLEHLSLDFCDPAPKRRDFRFKHRKEFATGLESLCGKLPCLKKLTIQRSPANGYPITDHSFRCQDLTDDQGVDPLCEAIRKLAQPTVTHLTIEGHGVSADPFSNQRPPHAPILLVGSMRIHGTHCNGSTSKWTGPRPMEPGTSPDRKKITTILDKPPRQSPFTRRRAPE
ncbi:hypothetical protein PG988_005864 [Apiospora saccharicola]